MYTRSVREILEKLLSDRKFDEMLRKSEHSQAPVLWLATPFSEGYERRPSRGGSIVEAVIEALDLLDRFPRINVETADGEGLIGLRKVDQTLQIKDLTLSQTIGHIAIDS
jgi:hypothetical protein